MDQRGEDFVNFLKRRYPFGNEKLKNELQNLKQKLDGEIVGFTCSVCKRKYNMQRHMKNIHSSEEMNTLHSQNRTENAQTGGNVAGIMHKSSDEIALDGLANKHYIFPVVDDKYDIFVFLANIKDEIKEHLKQRCSEMKQIKYYMNLQTEMRRQTASGEEDTSKPHLRSKMEILLSPDEVDDHSINIGFQKIFAAFDEYVKRGSSWTLKKIIQFEVFTAKYVPIGGRGHFELPPALKNSLSIINIKNSDDKCFLWSVSASLYPKADNPNRVIHYLPYENQRT
ncbi:hypothetical protein FSP39_004421 [Pinctada imbricata]|uniref:C2H2-type domain-containing protein n=1 Tax=Pinctada imbricata TaxID=66713 RepID=A0AA88XHN7_PINIB|nr:hypothetical protein FSP39_004421 [Pinctada imbricata]